MTDFRIDISEGIAIRGLTEGKPVASASRIVEISETRYGPNGRERKKKLLWGPVVIKESQTHQELLEGLAPVVQGVVDAYAAGEQTQPLEVTRPSVDHLDGPERIGEPGRADTG